MRLWGCAIAALCIFSLEPTHAALRRLTEIKPVADLDCSLPAHERTIREGVLNRIQQGNKSARTDALEDLRSYRTRLRTRRVKPLPFRETLLSSKLRLPSETLIWSALDLAAPLAGSAVFATDPSRALELTDSLNWILSPSSGSKSSMHKRYAGKSFESVRGFLRDPSCRGESCLPKHPDIESYKTALYSARQEALKNLRERKLPASVDGMDWAQIRQIQEVDFPYTLAVGRVLRLERQFFARVEGTLNQDRVACDPENRQGQPNPSPMPDLSIPPSNGSAAQSQMDRPGRT